MDTPARRTHLLRRVFVWTLRGVLALGLIVLALIAWVWIATPFNSDFPVRATPLEAASGWFSVRDANGVPVGKPDPQARILAQQNVGLGRRTLLYQYRSSLVPGATTVITPVTVAPGSYGFLRREQGWQPQAAAAGTTNTGVFVVATIPAGYLDNGGYATTWGANGRGVFARLTWSDGAVTETPMQDGAFLAVRHDPEYPGNIRECASDTRLVAQRVELLDAGRGVVETRTFTHPAGCRTPINLR